VSAFMHKVHLAFPGSVKPGLRLRYEGPPQISAQGWSMKGVADDEARTREWRRLPGLATDQTTLEIDFEFAAH
jgi:hypothetical protein